MNFEICRFWPIMQIRKKGGWNFYKIFSSETTKPIFNQALLEWLLDGPLPKLCPVILTSNQDGRQAQNRKRGDEILIVRYCFSVRQNELKF
jgi:hypothetical protein